ncbi:hypothetical protein PLICRDRAFT_43593 [Plicaturopsis crispa FD-325 SS-3]|nr:hypothetical protein PLICRDRAFT_43593 [Plicaturopsis crispa FD-325 SS-3]
MTPPLTFYDIPSTNPKNASSPNTWKVRYALNYKGIPYRTVWVEYPEIESLCTRIGAPPTSVNDNGHPSYTLPVINDHSTGAVVSDSIKIATYLDETYPTTPALFPAGSRALQHAFQDAFAPVLSAWLHVGIAATCAHFHPHSEEYFRRTREARFGMRLEDVSPPGSARRAGHMKAMKEGLDMVNGWLEANGPVMPYIMGNTVSYADLTLASWLGWFKTNVPEEWETVATWHGGRWVACIESLDNYAVVS